MTINLFDKGGCPLERQRFTWKELVQRPISKLDDDAFTRVRIILMNGVEHDALRMKQVMLRMNRNARVALAELMRVEHEQATMVNWLLSSDHSPLETTIGFEQTAIEVTASVASVDLALPAGAPGTPATAKDACPRRGGSGRLGGRCCPGCQASGKVNVGIGGA